MNGRLREFREFIENFSLFMLLASEQSHNSTIHRFPAMPRPPRRPLPLLLIILSVLLLSATFRLGMAHRHHSEEEDDNDDEHDEQDEDEDDSSCKEKPGFRVIAEFQQGLVTVDGRGDEWADVDGLQLALLPALDFDEDKAYAGGNMTIKAVHDGQNILFMLQVDGDYAYSSSDDHKCPSVALMFQIGENATYQNMGGCSHLPGKYTDKNCRGHEVDIMHFSSGNAIPGRLYGSNLIDNRKGNGNDSFGHLIDAYGWNPHCLYLDGIGPSGNTSSAQNDWIGAWWHNSLTSQPGFVEGDSPYGESGQKGTYIFEFSRPLRTMDRRQQDVQFTIGQANKVAVAFWYPTDGKSWRKSSHYSAGCNWLPLEVASASSLSFPSVTLPGTWDAATAFALLLSVLSFCLIFFVGYWASKTKAAPYTPMDHL